MLWSRAVLGQSTILTLSGQTWAMFRLHTLTDGIASRMLARHGISAVWQLQVAAAIVYRTLNPDSKCNTPGRFDIGKVDQDLEECCHAILRALVDRGERPTWDLARCWALAGGDLQGAGSG